MYRKHELLEAKLCKELDLIEEKYRNGAEMGEGDLRRVDLLAHALKCLAGYAEKKEAEEMRHPDGYQQSYGYMNPQMSQGMNPRFMSHDGYQNTSANGGYVVYPTDRRW